MAERSSERGGRLRIAAALLALVAIVGVVWAVALSQRLPEQAQEPIWDRDVCAHCRMHLGDPAFAAQIQVDDGRILHFDDPGCLLDHLEGRSLGIHAIWFHHLREDRWLAPKEVGFIRIEPTPMGYGLGAVERSTPGALTFDQALIVVSNTQPIGHQEEGHDHAP